MKKKVVIIAVLLMITPGINHAWWPFGEQEIEDTSSIHARVLQLGPESPWYTQTTSQPRIRIHNGKEDITLTEVTLSISLRQYSVQVEIPPRSTEDVTIGITGEVEMGTTVRVTEARGK